LLWKQEEGGDAWKNWRSSDPGDLEDRLQILEQAICGGNDDLVAQGFEGLVCAMPWLAEQIHGAPAARLLIMALADSTISGKTARDDVVLGEALHADLVPWLLGHSDPVRERVAARQAEASGE